MFRIIALISAVALLSVPAWSQETVDEAAEASSTEVADVDEAAEEAESPDIAPEPDDDVPEFDETGLDDQGYSNEDDDFAPSEDIPADQSIEFPADI